MFSWLRGAGEHYSLTRGSQALGTLKWGDGAVSQSLRCELSLHSVHPGPQEGVEEQVTSKQCPQKTVIRKPPRPHSTVTAQSRSGGSRKPSRGVNAVCSGEAGPR